MRKVYGGLRSKNKEMTRERGPVELEDGQIMGMRDKHWRYGVVKYVLGQRG